MRRDGEKEDASVKTFRSSCARLQGVKWKRSKKRNLMTLWKIRVRTKPRMR